MSLIFCTRIGGSLMTLLFESFLYILEDKHSSAIFELNRALLMSVLFCQNRVDQPNESKED